LPLGIKEYETSKVHATLGWRAMQRSQHQPLKDRGEGFQNIRNAGTECLLKTADDVYIVWKV